MVAPSQALHLFMIQRHFKHEVAIPLASISGHRRNIPNRTATDHIIKCLGSWLHGLAFTMACHSHAACLKQLVAHNLAGAHLKRSWLASLSRRFQNLWVVARACSLSHSMGGSTHRAVCIFARKVYRYHVTIDCHQRRCVGNSMYCIQHGWCLCVPGTSAAARHCRLAGRLFGDARCHALALMHDHTEVHGGLTCRTAGKPTGSVVAVRLIMIVDRSCNVGNFV